MSHKINAPHPEGFTRRRWVRLAGSLILAFTFALVALLIPVTAGTTIRLPLESGTGNPATGPAVEVALPFGAQIVRATGGLTITKSASPTEVGPGGTITYTLTVSNDTGSTLTNVAVTDTVPLNTECSNANYAPPGGWLVNGTGNCRSIGEVRWFLASVFGNFPSGTAVQLYYTVVATSSPLAPPAIITNTAGSYGVEATVPTTYTDIGLSDITVTVKSPAWDIGKSVTPSPTAEPGDYLTYTLTITNSGTYTTSGLYTLTDQLPAHTGFVTASPPGSESGGVVTWGLSDPLGPGDSVTATMVLTITRPLTDGEKIVNQTYSITGGNTFAPASGNPVTITVVSPVTMSISKADSPDPVQAGALLLYTLTVTNNTSSKGPAAGVVVTDAIPANTVFDSAGFAGGAGGTTANNGSVVTWTITSPNPVPVGQAVQLTLGVRVQSPLPNGTILTNTYGVTAPRALAPVTGAAVTTTVESSPNITLSKTVDPQLVSTGRRITYTIVVTNTGNETAANIPFTDTVQAPDFTVPVTTWNGTIPGRDLSGSPGVVTFTLVATTGNTTGNYPNVVTTTVRGSNISIGPVATVTVVSPVDLQVNKRALITEVVSGGPITYTITITNAPGSDSINAVLTDTFTPGSGATVGSITTEPGGPACSGSGSGPVVCNISNFTNTHTITLVLNTSASFAGVLTNTAYITPTISNIGDKNGIDNTSEVTATVRFPQADLELAKSTPSGQITATGQITYAITITNHGPDPVGVVVTDTFAPASGAGFTACSDGCSNAGANTTWNSLPVLNSGDSRTLVLTLTTGVYSGTLTNTAGITFSAAYPTAIDPGPNPNSDQTTTPVVRPLADLEISKSTNSTGVEAGNSITYTITITNNGPNPAGVVVTDTFAPASGAGFTACSDGCSNAGANTTWNSLPVLNSGDSRTLVLTLTTGVYSGTLTNTAGITFSSAYAHYLDSGPNPNSDQTTTPVRRLQANLIINKELVGSSTVPIGQPVTYTLTITNAGPDTVNAVITDSFANAAYQSYSATYPGASCSSSTSTTVVCNVPNFTNTTVITLVLNTSSSSPGALINVAEIKPTGTAQDPTGPNTSVAPIVTLQGMPVLVFTKTASPASGQDVRPGQTIVYNLQLTNLSTATADASNVYITDTLPSGVGLVSTSSNGSHTQNGNDHTYFTATLARGSSLTATLQVTVTAAASGTLINNSAVAASTETGSMGPAATTHRVVTNTATVYLPLIMKEPKPDLIASFSLNPPNPTAGQNVVITVVVTNTGSMPTGEGFWVDFYIDPNPVPTQGNQRWDALGSNVSPKQGIAWKVASPGLGVGQSITLTSNGVGGQAPSSQHTIWGGSFVSGTQHLYVYVDSFSLDGSANGGILEISESNNRSELHFVAPLSGMSTLEAGSLPDPAQIPARTEP